MFKFWDGILTLLKIQNFKYKMDVSYNLNQLIAYLETWLRTHEKISTRILEINK
jgi:hypothetical protein